MRFNIDVLNRLMAGSLALVTGYRAVVDRNLTLQNRISELESQLGEAQSNDAAQDADITGANDAVSKAADEVEKLVHGEETPPAPVEPAPEDAAAVVSGDTPVEAQSTDTAEFVPGEQLNS